ncbi:MAG: methyltransferase family protein [Paludibacteraceae bacterium]
MNNQRLRNFGGYVLGFILFVVFVPLIMWLVSPVAVITTNRYIAAAILLMVGLSLSIWTIVYMKRVGNGNPMDAFGHAMAEQTSRLMTKGPYRLCRNPMLLGIFIYATGFCVMLWTWQALVVFIIFVGIMMVQVLTEEKRLRADFGKEYDDYCARTGRFVPWSFKK